MGATGWIVVTCVKWLFDRVILQVEKDAKVTGIKGKDKLTNAIDIIHSYINDYVPLSVDQTKKVIEFLTWVINEIVAHYNEKGKLKK